MGDVIHVAIVEDDPFARNWMALVAARDWRTRVVGDVSRLDKLPNLFKDHHKNQLAIDLIVLDIDIPGGENLIPDVLKMATALPKAPKILCTGICASAHVLRQLNHPYFVGYILKEEICYSIAWAISLAIEGNWVVTDSVHSLASSIGFQLPMPCLILDGRRTASHLPERQAHIARLAFIFSMERRELADELGVGDWSYGLVSEIYDVLGVRDILTDEKLVHDYFGDSKLILSYIRRIKEETRDSLKARDMETLAFHMITMPEIREVK